MPNETVFGLSKSNLEKYESMLLAGEYREVEDEIYAWKQEEAASIVKLVVDRAANGEAGHQLARQLRSKYEFRTMKRTQVEVILGRGDRIKVTSWYGLNKYKKKGPFKKGRNGNGAHILLSYWGYLGKRSPNYVNHISRCGTASASYDLAAQELKEQGIPITPKSVDYLVQQVGDIAQKHRGIISISEGGRSESGGGNEGNDEGETLKDKRVMIALDGGRVRTRQRKLGRKRNDQKRKGFDTPWREPKLLVISELDEEGKKKKNTKPIYEATLHGPQELYQILLNLCLKLNLSQAKEIICIGDGANWIWNIFSKLTKHLRIKSRVTEIVDWYHAVEHITQLAEAHLKLVTEQQKREWANKLKGALRSGKFNLFKHLVSKEAKIHNLPQLIKQFKYFDGHRHRMRYDVYEANNQPIGSGMVESAIKRVINARIKSSGSFWNPENAEKMLQLRCILLSGRWKTFMHNFVRLNRLSLTVCV